MNKSQQTFNSQGQPFSFFNLKQHNLVILEIRPSLVDTNVYKELKHKMEQEGERKCAMWLLQVIKDLQIEIGQSRTGLIID